MDRRSTTKGTASLLRPSDGMILLVGSRLEGHSVTFLAIQAHFSRYFHRAVDFLGLRRGGSLAWTIDWLRDCPEQSLRHGNLSQLERDVAAVADNLGTGLDRLLPQSGQQSVPQLCR